MTVGERMDEILGKVGLPYAFNAFPTQSKVYKPPDPPFITYLIYESSNFFADNTVYSKIHSVGIELYTDSYSPSIEAKVEKVLMEQEIAWEQEREWIDDEKMYQIVYSFQITEREDLEDG